MVLHIVNTMSGVFSASDLDTFLRLDATVLVDTEHPSQIIRDFIHMGVIAIIRTAAFAIQTS